MFIACTYSFAISQNMNICYEPFECIGAKWYNNTSGIIWHKLFFKPKVIYALHFSTHSVQ